MYTAGLGAPVMNRDSISGPDFRVRVVWLKSFELVIPKCTDTDQEWLNERRSQKFHIALQNGAVRTIESSKLIRRIYMSSLTQDLLAEP